MGRDRDKTSRLSHAGLLRPGFMHSHTNSEIDFTEANEGNEERDQPFLAGLFLTARFSVERIPSSFAPLPSVNFIPVFMLKTNSLLHRDELRHKTTVESQIEFERVRR